MILISAPSYIFRVKWIIDSSRLFVSKTFFLFILWYFIFIWYMKVEIQNWSLSSVLLVRQTVIKSKYLITQNGIRPEIFRFVTTAIKRSIFNHGSLWIISNLVGIWGQISDLQVLWLWWCHLITRFKNKWVIVFFSQTFAKCRIWSFD